MARRHQLAQCAAAAPFQELSDDELASRIQALQQEMQRRQDARSLVLEPFGAPTVGLACIAAAGAASAGDGDPAVRLGLGIPAGRRASWCPSTLDLAGKAQR